MTLQFERSLWRESILLRVVIVSFCPDHAALCVPLYAGDGDATQWFRFAAALLVNPASPAGNRSLHSATRAAVPLMSRL